MRQLLVKHWPCDHFIEREGETHVMLFLGHPMYNTARTVNYGLVPGVDHPIKGVLLILSHT